MTGRIPYADQANRRLDPIRIRETNEAALFERLVRQLMEGLLHGQPWDKVTWEAVPDGAGGKSNVTMDLATWVERVYDYTDAQGSAFIDVESTVRNLAENDEYVAGKILYLVRMIEAPGGIPYFVKAIRQKAKYAKMRELTRPPLPFLIFVSNRTERLPDLTALRSLLKGRTKKLPGSDPGIECVDSRTGNQSFVVTTPNKTEVFVGYVGREKLLELTYLAQALDEAKHHDEVDERFLHELTTLCGHPLLFSPMPRKVGILAASPPAPIQVDGKHVTFYKFSIDPFQYLRMCTVLRLVSDYAFLQRLPDGGHLADMAHDIEAGGRFPTPVLCIPPESNVVEPDSARIVHSGGSIITPYGWHIVDGQHRAYSFYLVKPGTANIQDLDVNCYVLSNARDQPHIASALFLNVNFKALKPPIDLALAHYAYASQWPSNAWVIRKRGRGLKGDSQLYSARILASRFLLELSGQDTVFQNFFKYRGAKDKGKTSIQSISTYLSPDFELHDPTNPKNPFSVRYGTVKGASGIWTAPDPSPDSLTKLWAAIVDSFDEFATLVAKSGAATLLDGQDRLRALVAKNNNVFVALWRAYFWYSFQRAPGPGVPPVIPERLARRVIPALDRLDSKGFLSGPKNKYRSGSGAVELSSKMIKLIGGP